MTGAATRRLRFVHVSDLHIGRHRLRLRRLIPFLSHGLSAADPQVLQQLAVETAYSVQSHQTPGMVHCVASGDLSSLGGEDEIRDALAFLQRQLVRVHAGLGYRPPGLSSHVLGNHDVWGGGLLRGTLRSSKARAETQLRSRDHPRTLLGDAFYADVGALRVRIYLADSTKAGLGNFFAAGKVSHNELETLRHCVRSDERTDRESGAAVCLRVLVMHHPLSLKPGPVGDMALENAQNVGDLLEELGFGLIFCGHDHEQAIMQLGRWDMVECIAGSASQSGSRRNTYLTHDIDTPPVGHGLARVAVRISCHVRRSGAQQFSASRLHNESTRTASLT